MLDALIAHVFGQQSFTTRSVSGGDINQVVRVDLVDGRRVLVKLNASAAPGFFAAEAHGLTLLRDAIARSGAELRVPEVLAQGERTTDGPAYLALEWLERVTPSEYFGAAFGRALAVLHQTTTQQFGLGRDNFIGRLPQSNTPAPRWIDFYREQRLLPQITLARQQGLLPRLRAQALERLLSRLDALIPGGTRPSLLHGDLWSGNYLPLLGDVPALIDPAVYYGDREIEIAFTALFGGFPRSFYAAYEEAYPLPWGHADRRALYQLYPLLVHLNLFGETYGSSVDAICRQYA